jgi:two-component system response regulator FixJ
MIPTVFVVDDDSALRQALTRLLETAGFRVSAHADGASFLAACNEDCAGCVVLDMAMPGMDGRDVQEALDARGIGIPVVFLSGHGDIRTAVRSVQAGALDFLEKPVDGGELLARVRQALELDQQRRSQHARRAQIRRRYAKLSPREREVLALVVAGSSSKEIARKLDLSPRTIEAHRANLMHKMGADSLAELVSMAAECKD